jgi:hypothetical protein
LSFELWVGNAVATCPIVPTYHRADSCRDGATAACSDTAKCCKCNALGSAAGYFLVPCRSEHTTCLAIRSWTCLVRSASGQRSAARVCSPMHSLSPMLSVSSELHCVFGMHVWIGQSQASSPGMSAPASCKTCYCPVLTVQVRMDDVLLPCSSDIIVSLL